MRLTIESEPRELIMRDFEAHAASGRAQIEEMLRILKDKGEDAAFAFVRKKLQEEKNQNR